MTITIQTLEEADVPTFVSMELEAFRPHPRMAMLFPRGYTADLFAYYEHGKFDSCGTPNERLLKAVDESGKMIAGSEWTFTLDVEAEAEKTIIGPDEPPPSDWPTDGNWQIRLSSKREWASWKREVFAGRLYIGKKMHGVD